MTCLMSKICAKADGCDIHIGTNIEKCSAFKEQQTNFARITSSPEALAEFISGFSACCDCPADKLCANYQECYKAILIWLKQESK